MPINLNKERLYPLRIAVRFAPRSARTGRCLHVSVLYRWARKGVLAPNGSRVHLGVVRCASGLATSREALSRFLAELSDSHETAHGSAISSQPNQAAERRKAQDDAERELDAAGI